MHRRIMITLLLSVLLLSSKAYAYTYEQESFVDSYELQSALPSDAADIMEDESIIGGTDSERVANKLIQWIKENFLDIFRQAVLNSALLVLVAVLCAIGSSFIKTDGLGDVDYISLVGIVAVASLSFGGMRSFSRDMTEAIEGMEDFSKILLPAMAAAGSVSGNVAGFSVRYAVSTLFITLMITGVKTVILPLAYGYMASSIASSAFGGEGLKGAASLIKWAAVNILTVTTLIFTLYISISGAVSGTVDATATRLTKTVLSTTLPVVGGILSDAAQTVLLGAATIKNAIGVYGLFAVMAICLAPFLRLGVNYLIYKGASMLALTLSQGPVGKTIGAIGTSIGILLGSCGACAMMLFFSILSAIKAVGAV